MGELITTITTNAEGYYAFGGLENGKYGIYPQHANYIFSPSAIVLNIPQTNIQSFDFTGTKIDPCDSVDRFLDNEDGTITDCRTDLIWLMNANCTDELAGISKSTGRLSWDNAIIWSNALDNGTCDLIDGSVAGDWRLPTKSELQSIGTDPPTIWGSDYPPTENPWTMPGTSFVNVQFGAYWSSIKYASDTSNAWYVNMNNGYTYYGFNKDYGLSVWPVRSDN